VVSRRTLVCRRCGKRQRIDPRATVLACAGLFLIGVFAVATAGAQLPFARFGRKSTAAATGTTPAAPEVAALGPSAESITATELFGLYNVDPAKADARFKNRPVAISGRVAEVRRDYRGDLVVRLATGQPFDAVRATALRKYFETSIPAVGQNVALSCTGRGALIGAPILDDCAPL
jgi:hypothetical protein